MNRLRVRDATVRFWNGYLARNRIFSRLDEVLALGVPDVHLRLWIIPRAAALGFIPLG